MRPRIDAAMVSYNDTEFIILGGYGNSNSLSDVSIHSTASESLNGTLQPRTIVEKNAAGHIKLDSLGN